MLTERELRRMERVRAGCAAAAASAYEDAGMRGICAEGRWECALEAIRALNLERLANLEERTDVE